MIRDVTWNHDGRVLAVATTTKALAGKNVDSKEATNHTNNNDSIICLLAATGDVLETLLPVEKETAATATNTSRSERDLGGEYDDDNDNQDNQALVEDDDSSDDDSSDDNGGGVWGAKRVRFGGKSRYLCITVAAGAEDASSRNNHPSANKDLVDTNANTGADTAAEADTAADDYILIWDMKKRLPARKFELTRLPSQPTSTIVAACIDPTDTYVCVLQPATLWLFSLRQATLLYQWCLPPHSQHHTDPVSSYSSASSSSSASFSCPETLTCFAIATCSMSPTTTSSSSSSSSSRQQQQQQQQQHHVVLGTSGGKVILLDSLATLANTGKNNGNNSTMPSSTTIHSGNHVRHEWTKVVATNKNGRSHGSIRTLTCYKDYGAALTSDQLVILHWPTHDIVRTISLHQLLQQQRTTTSSNNPAEMSSQDNDDDNDAAVALSWDGPSGIMAIGFASGQIILYDWTRNRLVQHWSIASLLPSNSTQQTADPPPPPPPKIHSLVFAPSISSSSSNPLAHGNQTTPTSSHTMATPPTLTKQPVVAKQPPHQLSQTAAIQPETRSQPLSSPQQKDHHQQQQQKHQQQSSSSKVAHASSVSWEITPENALSKSSLPTPALSAKQQQQRQQESQPEPQQSQPQAFHHDHKDTVLSIPILQQDIETLHEEMQDSFRRLHVDLLRQFHLQSEDFHQALTRHSDTMHLLARDNVAFREQLKLLQKENEVLRKENQDFRQENERLRRLCSRPTTPSSSSPWGRDAGHMMM